jgi:hypothetical protein
MAGGKMSVLHDHGQGGMPEEVGYGLHTVTIHRQVRCEGMPQIMEPEIDDAGSTTSAGKPVLNVLPGLAMLIAKDHQTEGRLRLSIDRALLTYGVASHGSSAEEWLLLQVNLSDICHQIAFNELL